VTRPSDRRKIPKNAKINEFEIETAGNGR